MADPDIVRALQQNPTEDNIALAFRLVGRDEWRYLHGGGGWHRWDGRIWVPDKTAELRDQVRVLAREYNPSGKATPARASFVTGVEQFLRADRAFARHIEDYDRDNYLLSCEETVWDLRNGGTLDHDPERRITKITACEPEVVTPAQFAATRFARFLDEITAGDESLREFHQVSLGACLSGAVETHWLLFWHGPKSRNGKNTLGDLVRRILGSYAGTLPASALMSKQNEAHPAELMTLRGKRLVVSSEVPEGSWWNEARLKELTGDEVVNARAMRQDWVTFRRTHKHLIYANHRPQVRSADLAFRERLKMIPFNVSFRGREDPDLAATLWDERRIVLAWLIEGHEKWLTRLGKRLPDCQAVSSAGDDFYDSQSTVDNWLEDRTREVVDPDRPARAWPKAGHLFEDYRRWKLERGEHPVSMTRWGDAMSLRYSKIRGDGVRYQGLELLP